MRVFDLFSGAGGIKLGFENEGFETAGFIEFWNPAIETILANDPEAKLIAKDIREATANDIKKAGKVDVVCGGPPCQGFSMAGKREVGDHRNSLWKEYLRIVDTAQPKFCLMENVKGILTMRDTDDTLVIKKIYQEFANRGYAVKAKVLNSANYSVPQARNRVIIVANNQGIDYQHPAPHERKVFVQDVLNLPYSPIPELQHHWEEKPKLMRKSFNLQPGDKISSFGSAGKKIEWTLAPTITKTGRYIHPGFNRPISVREAARIQTFPDKHRFSGTIDEQYGQIGNAVPVHMARALAKSIKEAWKG